MSMSRRLPGLLSTPEAPGLQTDRYVPKESTQFVAVRRRTPALATIPVADVHCCAVARCSPRRKAASAGNRTCFEDIARAQSQPAPPCCDQKSPSAGPNISEADVPEHSTKSPFAQGAVHAISCPGPAD